MNYLGHAYLSFAQAELLAGQMIADYIKGKQLFELPDNIQKGILLHRFIDQYTDSHQASKVAKKLLKPFAGRYAAAFTDVVWDYFLANDTTVFSTEHQLNFFAQACYDQLQVNEHFFPEKFIPMFQSMQKHNWFYNYRTLFGMEKSFQGLVRRASHLHDHSIAFKGFVDQIPQLEECYRALFPDVKNEVLSFINNLQILTNPIFVNTHFSIKKL